MGARVGVLELAYVVSIQRVLVCAAMHCENTEAENTEMLDAGRQHHTQRCTRTQTEGEIQKASLSTRRKYKILLNIKLAPDVLIQSLILWTKRSWSSRVEGKPIQVLSVLFGEVAASMLCFMPAATPSQAAQYGWVDKQAHYVMYWTSLWTVVRLCFSRICCSVCALNKHIMNFLFIFINNW